MGIAADAAGEDWQNGCLSFYRNMRVQKNSNRESDECVVRDSHGVVQCLWTIDE